MKETTPDYRKPMFTGRRHSHCLLHTEGTARPIDYVPEARRFPIHKRSVPSEIIVLIYLINYINSVRDLPCWNRPLWILLHHHDYDHQRKRYWKVSVTLDI